MKHWTSIARLLVAVCVAPACIETASSQTSPLAERLAHATRLDCRFLLKTTGTWDDGAVSATIEPVELEAAFSDIDVEEGTANAEGRVGSSYIIVRQIAGYLHLIQLIDIGTLYVTTVMAEESSGGRLKAIHTRHKFAASSYPAFRERPEMYLGDCEIG